MHAKLSSKNFGDRDYTNFSDAQVFWFGWYWALSSETRRKKSSVILASHYYLRYPGADIYQDGTWVLD